MKIIDIKILELAEVVKINNNFKAVLKNFGFCEGGTNIKKIKEYLIKNKIDFSHFKSSIEFAKQSLLDLKEKRYNDFLVRWKNGLENGWTGKAFRVNSYIKKYLFLKYNNKCCKCGWNKINPITKKIPLEINHIDGNAANCKEKNLELICPNCHSLTPNFRNLNKKSCRIRK